MIEKQGMMFPDTDKSDKVNDPDIDIFAGVEDQLDLCAEYIRGARVCLDIGAHIGINTMVYSDEFEHVHSFEPLVSDCLEANVGAIDNVTIHKKAVGEKSGKLAMYNNTQNSMRSFVEDKKHEANNKRTQKKDHVKAEVEVISIDDLNLQNVDFVKIDVEGYNKAVLTGMVETINRCRPVILIEDGQDRIQNDFMNKFFQTLKYNNVHTFEGPPLDFLFVPE